MHVVHLPSWYPTKHHPSGGTYFREQIDALSGPSLKVGVLFPELRSLRTILQGNVWENRFQVDVVEESGVRTVRVKAWNPPEPRVRVGIFGLFARRAFDRYCSEFGRPDLIHAQSALPGGAAGLKLWKDRRIPYLLTEHSSRVLGDELRGWEAERIRRVMEEAQEVSAVSGAVANALSALGQGVTVHVIPNMVDTGFFTLPPGGRDRSDAPPFRFLAAGNLHPKKGFDVLVQAFALAFDPSDEVELVIAGRGSEERALRSLATELSVGDRVRFPGFLSRDELRQRMWRSDTFVLSSRRETFGIVLIEAMATGLPVIATRSGGPQELVIESAGRLCDSGEPGSLARAMKEACASSGFGVDPAEVRERVIGEYGVDSVRRRYIRLYRRTLTDAR